MRRIRTIGTIAVFAALVAAGLAGHAPQALAQRGAGTGPCDRACLEGFVDQYLDAVLAHDPKRVPIAPNAKFTENGVRLELGDGLWRTMIRKGTFRLFVTDVEAGRVGFIGTIFEEGAPAAGRGGAGGGPGARGGNNFVAQGPAGAPRGGPGAGPGAGAPRGVPGAAAPGGAQGGAAPGAGAAIAVHLKVVNRQLTEIETLVIRTASAQTNMDAAGGPDPLFLATIPESERASRADLVRVANMYFSGMQKNDGKGVPDPDLAHRTPYPFADDCDRFENGGKTANAPGVKPDLKTATNYSTTWSCKEQFESGLLHFVTRIRDRRYVAVDRERGLVYSFAFFDHSGGDTRRFQTPDGRNVTAGPQQPFTWQIAELFRIEKGQIRRIVAILQQVPYGMNSGWSSYEEGMSDKARDVTR